MVHLGSVGFVIDADGKNLSGSWRGAVEVVEVEGNQVVCFSRGERLGKTADLRPSADARHRIARQLAARELLDINVTVERFGD